MLFFCVGYCTDMRCFLVVVRLLVGWSGRTKVSIFGSRAWCNNFYKSGLIVVINQVSYIERRTLF